jgi:ethanolamine ammonia-lyase small subunit
MNLPGKRSDPWEVLRSRTAARIALGRAGSSLPTAEVLKFAADHAAARDAVLSEADFDALSPQFDAVDRPVIHVQSTAGDRGDYVRFPDKGRRLRDGDRAQLESVAPLMPADLVILVGDGLSAAALQHAPKLVSLLVAELEKPPVVRVGPVVLVRNARVAIEDEVGQALGVPAALILIGERPGLGAADSLGAYLVHDPKAGKTDADRNCVSNIRPAGLPLDAAADLLAYLVRQALARGVSGVALKDDRPTTKPLGRSAEGSEDGQKSGRHDSNMRPPGPK